MTSTWPIEVPPVDLPALARKVLEQPTKVPDIVTFAEDPRFLGDGGPGLLPRQRTWLRIVYGDLEHFTDYDHAVLQRWMASFYDELRVGVPGDVYERMEYLQKTGGPHFKHVLHIGGRRGGKNHLGGIIACYNLAKLLEAGDPQSMLGIRSGHQLVTMVVATEFTQARTAQFNDIALALARSPFFRDRIPLSNQSEIAILTDADIALCAELGLTDERQLALHASLRVKAFSSNAAAGRG